MSIQSLRTGVSGLRANQARLDTISNNISNSSTVAFKKGRVAFSEVMGQEILGVGRTSGGSNINPSQVGRGVSVGSVDRNFSQGSLDQTGIKTDLALSGDGFFVASPKEGSGSQQRRLTRAGNFTFNQNGEFVTANGLNVQGWKVDDEGNVNTGELENIQFDPNAQSAAKFTSKAEVGGNLSADAKGPNPPAKPEGDKSSISTTVFDEQGTAHNAVIEFEKTADNEWNYTIKAADSAPFVDGNGATDGVADGTITFNPDGSVNEIDGDASKEGPTIDWKTDFVEGSESLSINLRGLNQFSGSTTSKFQSQNGNSAGELSDFSITPEGELQLNFTNGEQEKLYQLAIGDVNNPNGLKQQGENFFTTTSASGDLQLGRAGRDLRTSVVSGSLESSNVDLADEFADLIEAQRSYQASSRVVTTADQVLQETVQLKR
jgi:flagellar hook protein FlgE